MGDLQAIKCNLILAQGLNTKYSLLNTHYQILSTKYYNCPSITEQTTVR